MPSHFTGVFFLHLLPVPVKTEHFLSLARQWFAVEIYLCQRQTKKEKEILEKWDVTPVVSERAAQRTGRSMLEGVAAIPGSPTTFWAQLVAFPTGKSVVQCFHPEIAQMGQILLRFWAHSETIGAWSLLAKSRDFPTSSWLPCTSQAPHNPFYASFQCKMHCSTYTSRLRFMYLTKHEESSQAACLQLLWDCI